MQSLFSAKIFYNIGPCAVLSGAPDVTSVEVVAVVVRHIPHRNPCGPDRIRVRAGVVVLRHAPSGDLAVQMVKLSGRVLCDQN